MPKTGSPNIPNKKLILKRIEDVLDSKILTNQGPYVQRLENEVGDYLQVPYVLAVSNATIGLELAIQAIFDPTKYYVLVPSFTFIATIHAIRRSGFTPIFIDIGEDYQIDINDLLYNLDYYGSKVAGIIPVNLFGDYCDIKKLNKITNVPIIYDSAHALGAFCDENETYIGTHGECEIFSLHATKLINSGEGGLITTKNKELYDKLVKIRNFGYVPDSNLPEGEISEIGTNAKMSEFHAAIGLTNFENIQEIIKHNFDNYLHYKENLPPEVIFKDKMFFSNFSYIPIEVRNRDHIINKLKEKNILARSYFYPCHLTKPYYINYSLPVTERISSSIIVLPQGLSVYKKDIQYICKVLKDNL